MYFSFLLLQPEHPFHQKGQKHKEGQKKLLRADMAILARVTCMRKYLKGFDLDQIWMDRWMDGKCFPEESTYKYFLGEK